MTGFSSLDWNFAMRARTALRPEPPDVIAKDFRLDLACQTQSRQMYLEARDCWILAVRRLLL